jgi:hypothetical protein
MAKTDIQKLMIREDYEHFHQHSRLIPELTEQQAWAEYQQRWRQAAVSEPNPNKRTNCGRRAANEWIRSAASGR